MAKSVRKTNILEKVIGMGNYTLYCKDGGVYLLLEDVEKMVQEAKAEARSEFAQAVKEIVLTTRKIEEYDGFGGMVSTSEPELFLGEVYEKEIDTILANLNASDHE